MAWTQAQIKAAKALYHRKGNRLSWAECIKRSTKGGSSRGRAVSGAKKKAPKKKVTTVKRVAVKRTVKISGTSGAATSELVNTQRKIEQEDRALEMLRNKSLAGMGAADKKAHRTEVANRKKYLQALKKHKTAIKRFI